MQLDQIKMLNLTENDFKLLVEGLDELPNKGASGELMMGLFTTILAKDEEQRDKMLNDQKRKLESKEAAKEMLREEIKILQGKLLMLKRYFQENNLLRSAYEILEIPK